MQQQKQDDNHFTDFKSVSTDPDKNSMRNRVRTLMKGLNGVKPFHEQEYQVIMRWLIALRQHHETLLRQQTLTEFWGVLVEESFCDSLLVLMSHSYADKIDTSSDSSSDEDETKEQLYPVYASEVLYLILLCSDPTRLKFIYQNNFESGQGLRIVSNCLRYGLRALRRYSSRIINTLLMRTPLANDGTLLDNDKGYGVLDSLIFATNDQAKKEYRSEQLYQSSSQEVKFYRQRDMNMLLETLSTTLSIFVVYNTHQKQLLLNKSGLIWHLMKKAAEYPHETFPESKAQLNYASALCCLCHISYETDNWKDHLRNFAEQTGGVHKILDILHSLRNIPDISSYIDSRMKQAAEINQQSGIEHRTDTTAVKNTFLFTELALLDCIASLSEVEEIAKEIYDYKDGWIYQVASDILFEETSHDSFRKHSGSDPQIEKAYNPQNPFPHPYTQFRPEHISLTFNGCSILLISNLGKYRSTTLADQASLEKKLKEFVTKIQNKIRVDEEARDYEIVEAYLTLAYRVASGFTKQKRLRADLLYHRAKILTKLKDYDNASKLLEQVLKLEKTHTQAKGLLKQIEAAKNTVWGIPRPFAIILVLIFAIIIAYYRYQITGSVV